MYYETFFSNEDRARFNMIVYSKKSLRAVHLKMRILVDKIKENQNASQVPHFISNNSIADFKSKYVFQEVL